MANRAQRSRRAKSEGLRLWLRENPTVQVALIGLAGTLIMAVATVIAAMIKG